MSYEILDMKFSSKRFLLIMSYALCLMSFSAKAQFYNLPNDYFFNLLTQKQLSKLDTVPSHPAIQPYIPFFNTKYNNIADTHRVFKYITEDPLLDKVFFDDLIYIKSKKDHKYTFRVNPLLNFETGRASYDTSSSQSISTNTRGFIASGLIGSNFYFETLFAENQSFFPHYMNANAKQTKIIPGQGRFKEFKKTGYDYAFSSGFFSFQAHKNVNIQLGHGKQKIGNGYRSLLLSDNAFNYPYARITSQWFKGKLQYSNIYAVLMNLTTGGAKTPKFTEPLFQKKAMATHYLSYHLNKRVTLGLFQSIIWAAADSMNRQQLEWQYFNPIIFSNLGFYGLNHKNNMLIGGDVNVKLSSSISVYGQFMADDLSNESTLGNAIGYQIGAKYFDAFMVKNLFLQLEYNDVAEGAYRNPVNNSIANQSFFHYNQNLAFTLNSGKEFVALLDYKYQRLFFNAKVNMQYITFQKFDLYKNTFFSTRIGYTINSAYNFNVSLGYTIRNQDFYGFNNSNNKTTFYTFAIKTNLYNSYYDF